MKVKLIGTLCLVVLIAVSAAAQGASVKRQIAITFDDLPAQRGDLAQYREETDKVLASIKRHHIPAVGFVNEGKLYNVKGEVDERIALLQKWLDAGLELGNHTFSHIDNHKTALPEYEADVIRGETVTRQLLQEKGLKLRYFRHPFLFTGPTPEYKKGLDGFLASRGYTVAPVTLDNGDYIFAYLYGRAQKRHDTATMKHVADSYVPHMEQMCEYFENLSRLSQGREIKQILLVHVNEINAEYFDDVVAMLQRRGYEFISLEEALKDLAYSQPEAQITWGVSWLHRWMKAKGQKGPQEPDPPADIMELYEQAQKKQP